MIVNLIIAFVNGLDYNWRKMIGEKRNYNSQKRALAAEQTRLRIIEAARALLSEVGYPNVSLDEIAERAGVSRQTIYVQFGSKRGVLEGVAQYIERLAFGTDDIVEGARRITHPIKTLRNGINASMTYYSENAQLLRTILAQGAYDADFREVRKSGEAKRRVAVRILVEHLHSGGLLADGWTRDEATDWLWSILSFETYDQLVERCGWTISQLSKRIWQMITTMLLQDEEDQVPEDGD